MQRIDYGPMLSTLEVIEEVERAIQERKPFSLVRVGDGENIVLAQRHVMPLEEVIKTRWGKLSRTTKDKGIRLPHEKARDRLIQSLRRADVVGIPHYNDGEIRAPQKFLRPLTDRCFRMYAIAPKKVCHTFVNRHMVGEKSFWEMLSGRKVAVISRWASAFAKLVKTEYADCRINFTALLPFSHYEEIKETVKEMKGVSCDLVLVSAGINALILCDKLAREQGRVALDFGKAAMFMVQHDSKRIHPWRREEKP